MALGPVAAATAPSPGYEVGAAAGAFSPDPMDGGRSLTVSQ